MKARKILALVCALLTLVCVLASCDKGGSDLEYVQKKGTMIVGITDYAPMDYKDENGEWTGFDAEFARLVAKELGVTAEFKVIEWDNKAMEVETKGVDCVWNGMTLTEEVRNSMDCSAAYVKNAQVVVMAADKLSQYADAASMKELKFAVEAGSAGEAAAKEAGFTTIAVTDQATALMEVASGTSDACVIDITMANAMTGEGTSYTALGYKLELTTEEYGIGFRKGSDMVAKVNEIMQKLRDDGTLAALAAKYNLTLA